VHPGDLAGGCSDLEMTWLLYCSGDTTDTKLYICIILAWSPIAEHSFRNEDQIST